MSNEETCLLCRHCSVPRADGWQPRGGYDEWDLGAVIRWIQKSGRHLPARCTFDPVWIDVHTAHYCGRFIRSNAWQLQRVPGAREVLEGSTWQQRALAAEGVAERMKQQLRTARSRSAKRLERLRRVRLNGASGERGITHSITETS
jgi:hypothetical protein